ncbi:class I SAM-dependent methyltransferase, partial [Candidatus Omnitrophota bacterium]
LLPQKTFEFFQRFGIHVTPKQYDSPIPDTRTLGAKKAFWEKEAELAGVDLNVERQLDMLENIFPRFRKECDFPLNKTSTPHEYFINNRSFGLVSAAVLHCMIRHFAPRTIIEAGSGNSTYVSARAGLMNQAHGQAAELISIEPYPSQVLKGGFPGLSGLIPKKVEDVDIGLFSRLRDRDILFIDSSHVVRTGGDVNFLYLEVLPRLKKGVVVHIHDIFFPRHYPKDWVIRNRRFWTEQYLLQAFLMYNDQFEVLWCGSYIYLKYPEKLRSAFPPPEGLDFHENYFSGSFWMRKI